METIITKRANGNTRVQCICRDKTRTEQAHKGSTNINSIVAKYRKTGFLEERKVQPTYGDFSTATDYHDIKNRLIAADADFMSLPSDIRNRFSNDPGVLLDFIDDPNNAAEAIRMGLLPKPVPVYQPEPLSPGAPVVEPAAEVVEPGPESKPE